MAGGGLYFRSPRLRSLRVQGQLYFLPNTCRLKQDQPHGFYVLMSYICFFFRRSFDYGMRRRLKI